MLRLKHVAKDDFSQIKKYITHPMVSKYLSWQPYTASSKIDQYFAYALQSTHFPDEIFSIIFNKKIIGTAHILNKGNNITQVGFGILPEFWNKGIGTEVAQKIIGRIENSPWSPSSQYILIKVHKKNLFAKKIADKLAFTLEKNYRDSKFEHYVLRRNQ